MLKEIMLLLTQVEDQTVRENFRRLELKIDEMVKKINELEKRVKELETP